MISIDATCPLVTKVHNETKKHSNKDRHILLIGHKYHPEVIGTMGQVDKNKVTLIQNKEDANNVIVKNLANLHMQLKPHYPLTIQKKR